MAFAEKCEKTGLPVRKQREFTIRVSCTYCTRRGFLHRYNVGAEDPPTQ